MYGKIFTSLYEGSMVGKGCAVFALWGYCISKADPVDHIVTLNPKLLCSIFGVEEEEVTNALEVLTGPDEESRCPDEEGRRLLHKGGHDYYLVTHDKYRAINSTDGHREYNREMKRRERERRKSMTVNDASMTVKNVNDVNDMSMTVNDSQKCQRHPVVVVASASGKGEEGMQGGKRGFQVDKTSAYGKKAIRLYETMENEGVTLVSNLKFEVFGKMVRDNPATRWFDLIDNLVTADLNSADGIKSPLGYMAKLTRGADFILAVGDKDAPKAKPGGKKSAENERSKIETYRSDAIDKLRHARDAGDLTAEGFLKKRDAAWDKGVALLAELAEKEKPQNRRG